MTTIEKQLRKSIYRREGYECALCGSGQHLQIHHYIPRGRGGSNHPDNLICLCAKCHLDIHGYEGEELRTWADQAAVEYLADLLTDDVNVWNPYKASGD